MAPVGLNLTEQNPVAYVSCRCNRIWKDRIGFVEKCRLLWGSMAYRKQECGWISGFVADAFSPGPFRAVHLKRPSSPQA